MRTPEYINRRDIRPITPGVIGAIAAIIARDGLDLDGARDRNYVEGFRVDGYSHRLRQPQLIEAFRTSLTRAA